MDLKELTAGVDINHWYYQAKFLSVKRMLIRAKAWPPGKPKESIIADIGAGSGIFTEAFINSLKAAPKYCYAVDIRYPQEFLGVHKGINFVRELPVGTKPSYLFFMDVIEHVDNDAIFLKRWVELSQPKSYFVFTVPAFRFLWSRYDNFLEHKRRYTLEEVEMLVSGCGLKVLRSSYFFAAVFPLVFLARKIIGPLMARLKMPDYQGIRPPNPVVNIFLSLILKAEIMLGLRNRIFGVSCILIAVKT